MVARRGPMSPEEARRRREGIPPDLRVAEPEAANTARPKRRGPTLKSTVAADVVPTRIEWLWRGWLPAGKLVIFEGDGGIGKSLAMTDIASSLTRGRPLPHEDSPSSSPMTVGFAISEDDVPAVVLPRLMAANADLDRVHFIEGVQGRQADEVDELRLDAHIGSLADFVEAKGVRLVVLDALMDYFGFGNADREQDVRAVLTPLKRMAEDLAVTIVGIRHIRKSVTSASHRGLGSVAFTNACRTVIAAFRPNSSKEEDDEEDAEPESGGILVVSKTNLGRIPRAIRYRIEPWANNPDAGRVVWGDETDDSADALCAAEYGRSSGAGGRATSADRVAEAIEGLRNDRPYVPAREIWGLSDRLGVSRREVSAAAKSLGLTCEPDPAWTRPAGYRGKAPSIYRWPGAELELPGIEGD